MEGGTHKNNLLSLMDDDFRNGKPCLPRCGTTGQRRTRIAWLIEKRNPAVFLIGLGNVWEFDTAIERP
jgi:hypothetical protein